MIIKGETVDPGLALTAVRIDPEADVIAEVPTTPPPD